MAFLNKIRLLLSNMASYNFLNYINSRVIKTEQTPFFLLGKVTIKICKNLILCTNFFFLYKLFVFFLVQFICTMAKIQVENHLWLLLNNIYL